jgi:hypothetical protein
LLDSSLFRLEAMTVQFLGIISVEHYPCLRLNEIPKLDVKLLSAGSFVYLLSYLIKIPKKHRLSLIRNR